MSLDTAVELGKEKRKPYRKPKSFDPWTRNHGKDSWMMGSHKKAYLLANIALVDAYLDMMEEADEQS